MVERKFMNTTKNTCLLVLSMIIITFGYFGCWYLSAFSHKELFFLSQILIYMSIPLVCNCIVDEVKKIDVIILIFFTVFIQIFLRNVKEWSLNVGLISLVSLLLINVINRNFKKECINNIITLIIFGSCIFLKVFFELEDFSLVMVVICVCMNSTSHKMKYISTILITILYFISVNCIYVFLQMSYRESVSFIEILSDGIFGIKEYSNSSFYFATLKYFNYLFVVIGYIPMFFYTKNKHELCKEKEV